MKNYSWKVVIDGKYDQEKYRTLYTVMLTAAHESNASGSRFVVSPRVAVMLQTLTEFEYAVVPNRNIMAKETLIGKLGNNDIIRDNEACEDFVKCYSNRKEKLAKLLDKDVGGFFAKIEVIIEK